MRCNIKQCELISCSLSQYIIMKPLTMHYARHLSLWHNKLVVFGKTKTLSKYSVCKGTFLTTKWSQSTLQTISELQIWFTTGLLCLRHCCSVTTHKQHDNTAFIPLSIHVANKMQMQLGPLHSIPPLASFLNANEMITWPVYNIESQDLFSENEWKVTRD